VYVRRGADNRFTGIPGSGETLSSFRGIEDYLPGKHGNAPVVLLGDGPALWTLRGPDGLEHSVTADESAPRCDRHPGELEWEAPRSFRRTASEAQTRWASTRRPQVR
jgi:hypothetical protein